jgi:hypothetical protein
MVDREVNRRKKILEYLQQNLAKGYSADSLKWSLLKQGHSRTDVEFGLEQVKELTKPAPVVAEKPAVMEIDDSDSRFGVEQKPWWKFW